MPDLAALRGKFEGLRPLLDERARRLWAAAEALSLGRGGVSLVAAATGMSRNTIRAGLRELRQPATPSPTERPSGRSRRPGAGRKPTLRAHPTLVQDLEALLEPVGPAGSVAPLRWTCKGTRQLALDLNRQRHRVGPRKVAELLRRLGYRLPIRDQVREGAFHPQRNAQFAHINDLAHTFRHSRQLVLAVHTQREVQASAESLPDATEPTGWRSTQPDHQTASFAVATLRRWWEQLGRLVFCSAADCLLLVEVGRKNQGFTRGWQIGLQRWADDTRLRLVLCYFPPGISKWQQFDQRLAAQFRLDGHGHLSIRHRVTVSLIGHPTAPTNPPWAPEGDPVSLGWTLAATEGEDASLCLEPAPFLGDWNCIIRPRERPLPTPAQRG